MYCAFDHIYMYFASGRKAKTVKKSLSKNIQIRVDNEDGSEKINKATGLITKKNKNFERAGRFLADFYAVISRLTLSYLSWLAIVTIPMS